MKKGNWITFTKLWSPYGELWATEQDPMVAKVKKVRKCGCCGEYEPVAGGRFWENRPEPDVWEFSGAMDEYETYATDDDLPAWAWGEIAEKDMTGDN